MVQLPDKLPGGDCPLTVAIKPKLHAAASSTVPIARIRCDVTEVFWATVFSSPRADACRAPIAIDTLSSRPTHCTKNLGSKNLGSKNLGSKNLAAPAQQPELQS